MPRYRLHDVPVSGKCYKLALMLTLSGETFEPVWGDFGGGITRSPERRASVNEIGHFPLSDPCL